MTFRPSARRLRLMLAAVLVPGAALVSWPAWAELPPLETRSVETRPAPKKPQDLLLPGETLRSRWADPAHPHAPGREAAVPAAPSRPARPARPTATGGPPPPPPLTASAGGAPVPVATPAARPRKGGTATKIRLGDACSGQYYLDGIAVDTMGRPCSVF